jgi:hypothetical protein
MAMNVHARNYSFLQSEQCLCYLMWATLLSHHHHLGFPCFIDKETKAQRIFFFYLHLFYAEFITVL